MRGEPGTLGLYWSDFQTAARPYELLELGITHRLMLGLRGSVRPKTHHDIVVSENSGTPKSSILKGFSIINHPFWGTPIFGNTHMVVFEVLTFSSQQLSKSYKKPSFLGPSY